MPRSPSVLAALLVFAVPAVASAQDARGVHDDMHELPVHRALQHDGGGGGDDAAPVTLYVKPDGATLTGGWDDASAHVSSVALRVDGPLVIPAWSGGARRWQRVMRCVRDRFGEFAIDVVDERPADPGHIMIVVGGEPGLLGFGRGVGGIAPYTGEVLPGAVGYVFSDALDNEVEATCVSIVHEAGHALGLDHAYLCEDPMSYLWGCGEKRFRDVDARCGEEEPRACGDGEVTQNSWQRLATHVGLRGEAPEEEEEEAPVEEAPPAQQPAPDDAVPEIAILGDDETLAGNQWIEIVVRARDAAGVAEVELGWASEEQQYVFACSAIPDDVPVACTREGDTFYFQLHVGTGLRAAVARATDRAGNQAVSEPRVLYLEE